MSIWHVQFPDGPKGPFDNEQLKTLSDTGTVNAGTLVWRQDFSSWRALAETDFIYKSTLPPPPFALNPGHMKSDDSETQLGFFGYGWRALTRKYATFSGRARRKEMFAFSFFQILIIFFAAFTGGILDGALGNIPERGGQMIFLPIFIALGVLGTITPAWAVTARRLHDFGWSGWFGLLILAPYIGVFFALIFLAVPGELDANKYGTPTKKLRV